jgi:hypothetical protein
MTALLVLLLLAAFAAVVVLTYLLGFMIGGDSWAAEVRRVRDEADRASREMYDLTRAAFVAMAEEAERRPGRGAGS